MSENNSSFEQRTKVIEPRTAPDAEVPSLADLELRDQYPQRLLGSQEGERRRRFTTVSIGALSALGAVLSVIWNQLILGCTFVAISAVNFMRSGLGSGRTPHPSNGSSGSSH